MAKRNLDGNDERTERMERSTGQFPAVSFPASNDAQDEVQEMNLVVEDASPSSQPAPHYNGGAKFVAIAGSEVIIDVNGNGERIPYVPEKHDGLKKGDPIER
jgi:hypothetical protein